MVPSKLEHLFDVKKFFEQMFAPIRAGRIAWSLGATCAGAEVAVWQRS
jgi:hypothetical protein